LWLAAYPFSNSLDDGGVVRKPPLCPL
jgi:hypothetical protein